MNIGPLSLSNRRLLLVPCVLLVCWASAPFWSEAGQVVGVGNYPSQLGMGIMAAAKLILAGVLFSLAVQDYVCSPFTKLVDIIFGLSTHGEKPPLQFQSLESYIALHMWDAVDREFSRLLEYYPLSLKVWRRYLLWADGRNDPEYHQQVKTLARQTLFFHPILKRKLQPLLS